MTSHYAGIVAGYAAASAALWCIWILARSVIAGEQILEFKRPWLEIGLVLVAAFATLGVGQAYMHDMLLEDRGPVLRSANQALIFAPLVIVVALRPHRLAGGGLPFGRPMLGLIVGVALAAGAVVVYAVVRGLSAAALFADALQVDHIPHAAQVLFEDIAIAALLLRARAALGARWAVIVVAALFAAGHIPAMLADGASLSELTSLLFDTGIGVVVMGGLIATRSIWWFWPLHAAMDLTQFYTPTP